MRKTLVISLLVGLGLSLTAFVAIAAPKTNIIKRDINIAAVPVTAPVPTASAATAATPLPRFTWGRTVVINDDTDKDLFTAGRSTLINGKVNGSVFAAGGNVEVKGDVTDNVIAAGGTVSITGNVGKNVILAGGEVQIAPTAHIGGYIVGAGGSINLQGTVGGSAKFAGGELIMGSSTQIGGELQANVDSVNGQDVAKIAGPKNISINEHPQQAPKREVRDTWAGAFTGLKIIEFLGKLIVLLVLLKLFGNVLVGMTAPIFDAPWTTMGWGLVKLIIAPIVIILMMITVLGIPLGFLSLILYVVSLYLAQFVTILALGRWIDTRFIKNKSIYLQGLIGLLILTALSFIPLIGFISKLITLLLGLGALFQWEKALVRIKNR